MMRNESDNGKWTKLVNLSSVFVLLIFAFFPSSGRAQGAEELQNKTLEYPCEVVFVLDGSGSVGRENFHKLLDVVRQFPKHFKMGNNYSRVAVVSFASYSFVDLKLTADENLVQALNRSVAGLWWGTMTDVALNDVKEKVFVDARSDAMKIVVLITDGEPGGQGRIRFSETEAAANELKKDGSIVYVAFVGHDYYTKPGVKQHLERVAGDPSQVFPMQEFDMLRKSIIPSIRKHIACQFQHVCRFDDPKQEKCVDAWWRPVDSDLNCTNAPPAQLPRQCQMGDCNVTCEKWPWQQWTCDGRHRLNISREGTMPPKQQSVFEHCLTQKEVVCPTVSLAVSPTAASPSGASADPGSGQQKSRLWVIAVIAVVIGLLLLLVVVAVVLTVRKRKKKREAAALAKQKAETAAATAKKATGSSSLTSGRSVLPTRSFGLEYGTAPAKMADHSMSVSLALEQSKPGGTSRISKTPRPAFKSRMSQPSVPMGAVSPTSSRAPVGTMGPKPSPGKKSKLAAAKPSPASKSSSMAKGARTKKRK